MKHSGTLYEVFTGQRPVGSGKDHKVQMKRTPSPLISLGKIAQIARIDGRAWANRLGADPSLTIPPTIVVQNHYLMSRDKGHLGPVPRRPLGLAYETYADAFNRGAMVRLSESCDAVEVMDKLTNER